MDTTIESSNQLFKRIETEIENYLTHKVEISEGVHFSQYKLITRINKFKNRDLSGSKLNPDLSYDYYFDIISPRTDSEVKNLRFDSKNVLVFSVNPTKDFPAVFIANASLKYWMAENGEDEKLKTAVEEFSANGNIGFKKVEGGYEKVDALNTYITNQKAETVDETDIVERHEMTASLIMGMKNWENKEKVIAELGDTAFSATANSSKIQSSSKHYEIYEFTGEVNEKEFNECKGIEGGDENTFFLAKVITAGLKKGGGGKKYTLYAEKLPGKISDYYIYAHRGRYEGRFWRVGMYEMLFDHQIRANEIGNQLARGMEWASKVVFKSSDSNVMQNIRADLDNGDVIITKDLAQLDVRMQGMDQLIADWNRLMADADRLSNSFEVVRGESLPSGTAFRLGALMDENAGKMFVILRQKISLPYKRVFKNWVLPNLIKDLKGEDIFRLVGDTEILDQVREMMVNSWYMENLVKIGPHTSAVAESIKAEKLDELKKVDPVIENSKEIWEGVLPRLLITITGENSDIQDQLQDLINLIGLEEDPMRRAWILDTIYKARNIPIPPKPSEKTAEKVIDGEEVTHPENGMMTGKNGKEMMASPEMRNAQQPLIQ